MCVPLSARHLRKIVALHRIALFTGPGVTARLTGFAGPGVTARFTGLAGPGVTARLTGFAGPGVTARFTGEGPITGPETTVVLTTAKFSPKIIISLLFIFRSELGD